MLEYRCSCRREPVQIKAFVGNCRLLRQRQLPIDAFFLALAVFAYNEALHVGVDRKKSTEYIYGANDNTQLRLTQKTGQPKQETYSETFLH